LEGARGSFNYEFSIDSGSSVLATYDFFIGVDQDSSAGIAYSLANPLFHWVDNSYGTSGTANGAGVEPADAAEYAAFPSSYGIAQNSQNMTFGDYPGGALPLASDATYSYELYAVASGAGAGGIRLANVGITVVIGNGGASVPDSGSAAALLGLGLAGILAMRKRAVTA